MNKFAERTLYCTIGATVGALSIFGMANFKEEHLRKIMEKNVRDYLDNGGSISNATEITNGLYRVSIETEYSADGKEVKVLHVKNK